MTKSLLAKRLIQLRGGGEQDSDHKKLPHVWFKFVKTAVAW